MTKPNREEGYSYELPRAENISRISDVINSTVSDFVDGAVSSGVYGGGAFPLTLHPTLPQFTVGVGHALDTLGQSVRITSPLTTYDASAPSRVDAQVPPQPTPQSTGSVDVPLLSSGTVDTYILIQYLSTVDLTVPVSFVPGTVHGYTAWCDGFKIITSLLADVPTHIAAGALFLGVITKNRSVVKYGGGFQRSGMNHPNALQESISDHSHTGMTLSFRCASLGPATGKVIVEYDDGGPVLTEFPVTGGSWHGEAIDLQAFSGRAIKVYLCSRGDYGSGAQFKWDGVKLLYSRNLVDVENAPKIHFRNGSFEQYTSVGIEPAILTPYGTPGVMDGWTQVDIGGGLGWSGIVADISGVTDSQYVLKTTSAFGLPLQWGAIKLNDYVTIPTTYLLNGAYSIEDGSIPESKLSGTLSAYVAKAGDTMTGPLIVPALTANGNITVTGNVDGVDVSAHKHTNAAGDAPKIESTGLAAGCVTAANAALADLSVATAKLQDSCVLEAKIADAAVKPAKLDNTASYTVGQITTSTIATIGSDMTVGGSVDITGYFKRAGANILPAGCTLEWWGSSAPAGWLLSDGKTIGNAGSGGSARANVDTQDLFIHLWTNISNTYLPIQDSTGAPTTRGSSASDDFIALKRLPLPDTRGRVLLCADNMGGVSANRVTDVSADNLGASSGVESVTLTAAQSGLVEHTHTYGSGQFANVADNPGGNSHAYQFTAATSGVSGGAQPASTAHTNMPPYITSSYIIKY